MRIHLATEHALEFEFAHLRFELRRFAFDIGGGIRVVFRLGQVQQFSGVGQRAPGAVQLTQFLRESRAFAAEFLRPVGL